LLFSLVIQKLIAAIAAKCPGLALNLWYLDDGVLAGRTADVAAALAVIAELGPDLGLELNLVKNEAVFFWDDTPDPFPKGGGAFPRWVRAAGLTHWRCGLLP
jgi:hypothetical protein